MSFDLGPGNNASNSVFYRPHRKYKLLIKEKRSAKYVCMLAYMCCEMEPLDADIIFDGVPLGARGPGHIEGFYIEA